MTVRGHRSGDDSPSASPELPDIVVGNYALRSFDIEDGRLKSLYRDFYWDEGKAVAHCDKPYVFPNTPPPHPAPHACGLYSLTSYYELQRQYSSKAARNVAVIAAEGRTEKGTKGLRCQAARIVAYWAYTGVDRKVFKAQCPEATSFGTVKEMLDAYKFDAAALRSDSGWDTFPASTFPQSTSSAPSPRGQVQSSPSMVAALTNHLRLYPQDRDVLLARFGWLPDVPTPQPSAAPASYGTPPTPLPGDGKFLPVLPVNPPGSSSAPTQLPPTTSWDNIAPLMSAGTPQGRTAVQGLLGYCPP
jgi:hypothetical protein